MNGIVITWPQLLYLGLILVLFYVAELLLFLRKSSLRNPRAERMDRLDDVAEDMAALRQEIESLKVRLVSLQMQQQLPSAPELPFVRQAEVHVDDDAETPYAQAIRMAQTGADADAVAAGCGISRGEADLIVALYRTGSLH